MFESPSVLSRGCLAMLLLVVMASLGFAPAPFPKPPKPMRGAAAIKNLMGDWHNPASPSVVVNITPTEFAYVNSGVRNNVYKLTLDATVSPHKYDIRKSGANFVGIWKIEGDKLTLRYVGERRGAVDGGRPTRFEDTGHLEIYYRVGAGKKR
jgi:hypothetical protein